MKFEVINADCIEAMRDIPDSSIDACVTDPPYNAINRKTGGLRLIDKDEADSLPVNIGLLAKEFIRVSRGSIYVWCSDEQYTDWTLAFKNAGLTTRKCAWWKTNPSPMNGERLWLSAMELCVFARKPNATFNRFCAAPVWKGASETSDLHPCEKPIWLMRELVTASTNEGDTVLDPFCGSGSTGVACAIEGRNFIGIELDPHYCEVSRARISRACGVHADIPRRIKIEKELPLFSAA